MMADLNPGADTIAFNIAGPTVIHPVSDLPAVTGPTTLDGTTPPGPSRVFIEGAGTWPKLITNNLDGLRITRGSTVCGLAIGGFTASIRPASASPATAT